MPLAPAARTAVLGGLFCLALNAPALAGIVAQIDQSRQRMRVFVNGTLSHEWPVSTARRGYVTPNGSYRVGLMAPMWRSHKYHNSPMPHAMFFRGGYAIHGTYAVGQLGNRASHGCIRLSPGNASRLFSLTRSHGGASVVIRN
ncbi:L,D-transpeptidase [uncultured Methylobacterium sp.]|uniref:L,D-transpeptidase n=1 Tax=uncultured Methylobacterium sp. TaxID=157278 RepID=UPI0035CB4399